MIAGGNAVDAYIAAVVCISIMNPQSAGLGGGHFATIYLKERRQCITINARETAPLSLDAHSYDGHEDDILTGRAFPPTHRKVLE